MAGSQVNGGSAVREVLLKKISEKKLLVSPEALDKLCTVSEDRAVKAIERFFEQTELIVTLSQCDEVLAGIAIVEQTPVIVQYTGFKPLNADVESQLEIKEKLDVSGKSRCTGTIEEFVGLFRDRFRRVKAVLKTRMTQMPLIPISSVKGGGRGRTGRIIGMVYNKQTTRNGHLIFEVEDEEANVKCLVMKDSPIREKADEIILDEVIALDGVCSEELFIVKDVIWPETPVAPARKTTEEDISIVCTSDTHVGSKLFMKDNFAKFIAFLNGQGTDQEREIAGKIKYISFAGDLVDGIGVYPEQEKELETKDIYTQYEMFCEYMKMIPEHIEVIISPGNHDAVRSAVPQPRLAREFVKSAEGYKNLHFVSNPSFIKVHGFNEVIYHGESMYAIANSLPNLRGLNTNPEKAGIEMIRRRLLNPIYGDKVPFAPEKFDYTVMDEVPDIFHFGDIHHNGYSNYHGTMIINSGCWQSKTDYQVRLGHEPTPCFVPLYNLKTNNLQVLNFGGENIL
ncbi:MAG: DNA-directed DNA polymerase II small subunit [Candidatus Micrarchaeota archaeon]